VRTFRLDEFPHEGTASWWACRIAGAAAGCAIVLCAIQFSKRPSGRIANLCAIGAAIGFTLAHPVARAFGRVIGVDDVTARFQNANEALYFDFGSLVVHLCGALVGGAISLGLGYDPPSKAKIGVKSPPLSICLFCAAIFIGLVVLMSRFFQQRQIGIYD